MNFEQKMAYVQRLSRQTLAVMAEIQSRPPRAPMPPALDRQGDVRMNHIKKTLAEIDEKLRRLRGLL